VVMWMDVGTPAAAPSASHSNLHLLRPGDHASAYTTYKLVIVVVHYYVSPGHISSMQNIIKVIAYC
jgi:hypothetical protein